MAAISQTPGPGCPVCGFAESDLVSRAVSGAPESAVYRCTACTLVFVHPIMTEEEETAFYRAEFEKYMARRSGPGWESSAAHFRSHQAEGERRLPHIRPYLKPDDRMLEVGSSTGFFLDDVGGSVSSVTGIEPHEAYREYASKRGIETVRLVQDLGDQCFDVITMFYVLEHLRDPVRYLTDLRSHLRDGGRLLIEVPNVEDVLLSRYAIPAFPPFYWQKAHYHYYSRKTLRDVLARAGYRAEVFPLQRYDLSNHLVWMMEGRPGGMGRFRQIFSLEVETAYAETLKRNWLCDTLFAVAHPSVS